MPDDGRRYELLSGVLVVSPRPTTIHQVVAGRLYGILSSACPEDLCVVPEHAVMLGPQTEFDPDLVVVRMDQIGGAKFTEPPLLVVEIRSPRHPAYGTPIEARWYCPTCDRLVDHEPDQAEVHFV
jgi:Uma2 family endonuclease